MTIVVDEKEDLGKVAEACREVGLTGLRPLVTSHLITGAIEEASLPKLVAVEGVQAVERQRTYDVS